MDKTGLTGLVLYKRDQDHNCKFFEGEMMLINVKMILLMVMIRTRTKMMTADYSSERAF